MPSDVRAFQMDGPSWSELASLGELSAVLSPRAGQRRNLFLHSIQLFGARVALGLQRSGLPHPGVLLDFGCGTGRFVRFFGKKGWLVIGTEITTEMLAEARRFGLPKLSALTLTDGVAIPLQDQSVDMVWVCGVLKFSLFPAGSVCRGGSGVLSTTPFVPLYRDIAKEMYRIVKPGGFVVNLEMYVDAQPEAFTLDFEQVGFVTRQQHILHRYGRLDRLCRSERIPLAFIAFAGRLSAAVRFWLDDPRRQVVGLRDYLFVWSKPGAGAHGRDQT